MLSISRRLTVLCLVLAMAALTAVGVAGAREPKQPATPAQIVAYLIDKGVIDEIPGAYKNIDEVMAHQTDLVEVVHTLKQVLCVKG